MNPALTMSAVGVVLALLCQVTNLSAQATNPIIGTWELNLAKSTLSPGPPPKSDVRTFEMTPQGIRFIAKITGADGQPAAAQYMANYDGKDYPITGSPDFDTIAFKAVDALRVEITLKKAGKVVQRGTRVISQEGRCSR